MSLSKDDYTQRYSLLIPMPHFGMKRTLDLQLFDLLPSFDPKTDKMFNHWVRFITFTQCYRLNQSITIYCLKRKLLNVDATICEKHNLNTVVKIALFLKHKYGTFPNKDDYIKQQHELTRRKKENIVSFSERAIYILRSAYYDKWDPNKSIYIDREFKDIIKRSVSQDTWRFLEAMEETYKTISNSRYELSFTDVIGLVVTKSVAKRKPNA